MSVTAWRKTNTGARRYKAIGRGEKMRIERELVERRRIKERKTIDIPEMRMEPPETTYGSNCRRAGGVAAAAVWVAIEAFWMYNG